MGLLALNRLICVESFSGATFMGLSFTALDKGSVSHPLAKSRSSCRSTVDMKDCISLPLHLALSLPVYIYPSRQPHLGWRAVSPSRSIFLDQIFKITFIRNLIHLITFNYGKEVVVTGKRLSIYTPWIIICRKLKYLF